MEYTESMRSDHRAFTMDSVRCLASYRRAAGKTLLGRLCLALYEKIAGTDSKLPSAKSIRLYFLNRFLDNAKNASCEFQLLKVSAHFQFVAPRLRPVDPLAIVSQLETAPLAKDDVFIELEGLELPQLDRVGVLVHKSAMLPSGFVYELTFFPDSGTTDLFVQRVEIKVCGDEPEPMFSVLDADGWKLKSSQDIASDPLISLSLSAICKVQRDEQKPRSIPTNKIKISNKNALAPPKDKILDKLLVAVLSGTASCCRAVVPLESIEPKSLDFCFSIPTGVVEAIVGDMQIPLHPLGVSGMVVYWDKNRFVMSDDYCQYLAFRKVNAIDVPVIILGERPPHIVPVVEGGRELLPPVTIMLTPNTRNLSNATKMHLLDERLRESKCSSTLAHLYALLFSLAEMVQAPHTLENELHDFLMAYPSVIGPTGAKVHSEVSLGDIYFVDLLIQNSADDPVELIELERANLRL